MKIHQMEISFFLLWFGNLYLIKMKKLVTKQLKFCESNFKHMLNGYFFIYFFFIIFNQDGWRLE